MIHMYAVPHSIASLPHSAPVGIGNMAYVTNTEIDNSGTLRAIHSHEDITEIGLVYQGNGVHLIDGALYHSKPGDLLLYNTKVLHQDIASSDEPMRFFLCGVTGLHLDGLRPGSIVPNPSGGSCHVESGVYFDFILNGFHMLEYSLKKQQSNVSEMAHGFLICTDCNYQRADRAGALHRKRRGAQPGFVACGGNAAVYQPQLCVKLYAQRSGAAVSHQQVLCVARFFRDVRHIPDAVPHPAQDW